MGDRERHETIRCALALLVFSAALASVEQQSVGDRKTVASESEAGAIVYGVFMSDPQASHGGRIMVNAFDGTRKPIADGTDLLLTITDGNQKQVLRQSIKR
jgi:hypothetical protein